jgi:hypothetical protein
MALERPCLAENSEYHAAQADQLINEVRIVELKDKLARAEVIDVSIVCGGLRILEPLPAWFVAADLGNRPEGAGQSAVAGSARHRCCASCNGKGGRDG